MDESSPISIRRVNTLLFILSLLILILVCPGKFELDDDTVLNIQFSNEVPRTVQRGFFIRDATSHNNHGLINAEAEIVQFYEYGDATGLRLSGDTYITMGSSDSLMISGDLTIEAWLKNDEDGTGFVVQNLNAYGFPNFVNSMEAYVQTTTGPLVLTGPPFTSKGLHYFAMVVAASEMSMYVDGKRVANRNVDGTRVAGSLDPLIGNSNAWSGNKASSTYQGVVFSIRISRVARTPEQILQHFQLGELSRCTIRTVPTFNSCTKCAGSPCTIHNIR